MTSATVAERQPRASSKPPTTAPLERPRGKGVRQVVGVATAAAGTSAASSGATTGQRINIWVRQPFELVLRLAILHTPVPHYLIVLDLPKCQEFKYEVLIVYLKRHVQLRFTQ